MQKPGKKHRHWTMWDLRPNSPLPCGPMVELYRAWAFIRDLADSHLMEDFCKEFGINDEQAKAFCTWMDGDI